ncbi:MAG: efflux RND transporter permease subunit [Planctomycetaceae bacterium]|nr:MAG: efflux RND transporter permease subunit [Planctomycetaceae bacterium]
MHQLVRACIQRPVFASMFMLSLVVVGAAGFSRLGVDRFPAIDMPTVVIQTELAGASAEEIETQITERLEEAVNTIAGIEELTSISAPGRSVIRVIFHLDHDINVATQDVRDRVASALRDLPPQAELPLVAKLDNEQSPVLEVALYGERSLRELTELADKTLKRRLERVPGVGEVAVVGGLERAISLWIDADRLAAYSLSITDVRDAVQRQNADVPGGHVTAGVREQTLRTVGRIADPQGFNDLVVDSRNGVPIRIRDLGWAEDGAKEQRSLARLNRTPAVTLAIRRQSGANTVAVIEAARTVLDDLRHQLPVDVQMDIVRDQSRYIQLALREIRSHLIAGSLLACLVVLLFLRNWQSMVIAGVAIPVSVIGTFAMMWLLDFTLNSVTMLALVLMVGVVIDDSLVVLENIYRFVEEKRLSPFEAASRATAEIGMAVLATTFCLVAIFVPVSFMSSVSGRFLFQFGLTAAAAVSISTLVSLVLAPMMSARMLRPVREVPEGPVSRRGLYGRFESLYLTLLGGALRVRPLVLVGALAIMASAIPLYDRVRQEYVPTQVDEGEFEVVIRTPEGVSVQAMDGVMQAMEDAILEVPGVTHVLAAVGSHLSASGSLNQTRAFVRIEPHETRRFSLTRLLQAGLRGQPRDAFQGNYTQRDVMAHVRERLRELPGVRVSVRNIRWFNLGGSAAEIDFILRGPDLQALERYAAQLEQQAEELGLMDANTTLQLDRPELLARIDRERAAALQVQVEDVATALRLMVGGDERVSRYRDPGLHEEYDVQIRLQDRDRDNPDSISRLYVPGAAGVVRVDNLVRLEDAVTASRIDRLDRQRQVSLRASIAPGFALADRLEVLRNAVNDMNLPSTYNIYISGAGRELERTFTEFLSAFALSLIFVYLILAAQYERLVEPLVVLLAVPLTVPFALLTLWLGDQTLNLYSALGLLVLFGVAMKQAVMQIDHTSQLRSAGRPLNDAVLTANRDRLRPILMTNLTLVAGMLPLVLGSGPGAEERRAVAVVVIGGLTLSLLLTLIVIPVAYATVDSLRERGTRQPNHETDYTPK